MLHQNLQDNKFNQNENTDFIEDISSSNHQQIKDNINNKGENCTSLERIFDTIEHHIRKKPIYYLFIASCIGFILGNICGRKMN
ncbi:MAG: hypothetical protein V6007_01985 [Candidatus Dasytiphilus stammeri]